MKPIVTWIVLANANHAHIVVNSGLGKGLKSVAGTRMEAKPPVEFSDRAGVGHSSAGPGISAVNQGDPSEQAEIAFATHICSKIEAAHNDGSFGRLLLVSGPHMLGLLRKTLSKKLQATITAEIPKDLASLPIPKLVDHLSDVMVL